MPLGSAGESSHPSTTTVALLALGALISTFLFDLYSRAEIAAGVLYILPVMLSTLLPWRHATLACAVAATLLTGIGHLAAPAEETGQLGFFLAASNRILALVAIGVTATLGLLWVRKDLRLREERARLNAVIGTSADAVITIDQQGVILSFSRAGERLFGYGEAEVVGRNVKMLMPSPDRERHDGYLERYLRTGERRIIGAGRQVEALRKDGTVFPVHLMVGEVRGGEQRLFTGFIHDMSERVAAEREAARERNFIAAMLDSTEALVVVVDPDGVILRCNAACARLTGYAVAELVGRPIGALIQGSGSELRPFYGLATVEISGRHEQALRCKGGEERLVSWSHAAIRDEAGVLRFLVSTGIDVTEGRRTEARARELQDHLYRIGRISELGEMASAIAHELNQPMTAVANYVNASRRMLQDVQAPEAGRIAELMDRAVQQTERAGQIVRRLRQLIGRGQSELQPTDLDAVVQEAAGLALIGAREQGIEARFELAGNLPPVLADATQLQQVVLNLVRNAVEALQAVERRELVVASRVGANGVVELSIADSGPGLDPEVADQLFMPFVSTKANGMGIGLSICRSIMDAHQGQIRAEPRPGGGTVFRVTLPAIEKGENEDAGASDLPS